MQKSELETRLDPQFYINRIKIKNSVKLSTLVKVKGGKRIPKGKYYSETPTEYQYLRVSDIQDFGLINWDSLKYIPEDVYYLLEKYKVEKGDVIISIAGTVGKTALIERDIRNTILTENCAILKIRDKSKLLPKFLHILLELSTTKSQIDLGFIQTTIPKLGFDKIEQLQLPAIPSTEKQLEIIEYYDKSIAQKQQNEVEADKLLSSIDNYLLNELGINLPEPPENTLKNRIFMTSLREITGERFDSFYHQTKFIENLTAIYNGRFPVKLLRETISGNLIKGSLPKHEEKDGNCSVIQINSITIDGTIVFDDLLTAKNIFGREQKLKVGDVLVVITGATIGKIAFWNYDGDYFLGGDIVKFQTNSLADSAFVFHFLRCSLMQTEIKRNITGATNGHLAPDNILQFPIPVPPLTKQKEIADHITGIRQQAQQLKDKTSELLKQASEEIEKILLN
ncbi:MAG TPA: restriction endonuclease subunit S [Bacteroidales bacterium]|nr:restriction endonuclease subunit S [Bacteroidales bacterium]